jgi:hypothetical protein
MKSLYKISKLLCAQELKQQGSNVEHQVVANFLKENYRRVFVFIDVKANAEKEADSEKIYCAENGINALPQPSTTYSLPRAPTRAPPPPSLHVAPAAMSPPTPQVVPAEETLAIRGGGGDDEIDLDNLSVALMGSKDNSSKE